MKHPPRNIDQSCFDWQKIILQKTDMPPNAKYMALYLASYMNMNRDVAWPSQKTIERETGLAHATVLKWIDFLVSEGWIAKQSGSRTESNRYWISFPKEVGQSLTYVNQREEVGQPLTSNNNVITTKPYIKGWEEWVVYRKEIKKKMSPSTVKRQVSMLEKHDPDTQEAIIHQSIQNGWTGLFPLKESHGQNGQAGRKNTSGGVKEFSAADLINEGDDITGRLIS